ncbi:MAG: hypothetical protein SNJ70_06780 [Armatimonadota bacterium]
MNRKISLNKNKTLNTIKLNVKQYRSLNDIAPHIIRLWSSYTRQLNYAIDNDRYC